MTTASGPTLPRIIRRTDIRRSSSGSALKERRTASQRPRSATSSGSVGEYSSPASIFSFSVRATGSTSMSELLGGELRGLAHDAEDCRPGQLGAGELPAFD